MTVEILRRAFAAEWTKLWSLRSTWWTLAGAFALMAAMAFTLATSTVHNNTNDVPGDDLGVVVASETAVGAVDLVQFVVLTLAILTITAEYATGSIGTTLRWAPRRGVVLLAKSAVLAAVAFPTGMLLGLLGTAVAAPLLGGWGRFSVGGTLADSAAIGVYLALTSVLVLGIGTLLRSTAGAVTTVFLFLMALPMLIDGSSTALGRWVSDALPSSAGRHFMNGGGDSYGPAAGLALLAVWTAVFLVGARTALRRRDA